MRSTHRKVALLIAASALLRPSTLDAQSILLGSVSGTVTSGADGAPLVRALVTLTALDGPAEIQQTTSSSGAFTFDLLAPGSYELRVEALGFRPLLATTVSVLGGTHRTLALSVSPAPPPVLTVDTVALGGASTGRWTAGGVHVSGGDLSEIPFRFDDMASAATLAPSLDEALGSLGLPGSMTRIVADGVPFYRARHPFLRGEHLPDALFPRSALSGLTVFHVAPDIEWAGAAGGYVALDTRTGTGGGGLEAEGAWSHDALWSSRELDLTAPGLTSFQAAARTTLALSPGGSSLVVSGEALRHEAPLAPRLTGEVASTLNGLAPEILAPLLEPSTERVSRYSGLVRFDRQGSATRRLFVRAAVGYAAREFDGSGPVAAPYGAGLPEESVDYQIAGGFVSRSGEALGLEIRAGVSGSDRSFERAGQGVPGAYLVQPASPLGPLSGGPAESSRTDVVLLPSVRYALGAGSLKGGVSVRASVFNISSDPFGPGQFIFSDGGSLLAQQGFGRGSDAPEASFTTQELGVFGQLVHEPAEGVRLMLGGRLDWEGVPGSEAQLNAAWAVATGLRNDRHPTSFLQMGARAALTWLPFRDGRTALFATASLDDGDVDPGVLYQLYSQDTGATSTRFAGAGIAWPDAAFPGGTEPLPTLTLLGPDTRPPRSARAEVAMVQQLGRGLSLHLGGSLRRTDFLVRRRNLNLPLAPLVTDGYGRAVFGTLAQDGALVTATGADGRRFPAFGDVWALDPDGWSEYLGGTLGVEYRGPALTLRGSYTRSVTEDNWVGAARGSPQAALSPLLPVGYENWASARSDFDVPDRVVATGMVRAGPVALSAAYHFRSGLPFTPGYRLGVDANGDGSIENDVAFVPDAAQLAELESEWPCLASQAGSFAKRNSCRGPGRHSLDARLRVRLGDLGGREVSLLLDAFNLVESGGGWIDDALLLVDPDAAITTSPGGGTVTIPVTVNPGFGDVLYPSTRGSMLRVGLTIG